MLSPLAIKKQMLGVWQRQHDVDSKSNEWCSILKAQQLANQITQLTYEITALEATEAAAKSPPEKSCEQLIQELWDRINAKTAASSSAASSSSQLDTQHNTQMASTHPQPNPQQITTQPPEQPAHPAPAPERFKQEVDYKYDGQCIMRRRKKLINTVDLIISLFSATSLILHCSAPKNGPDGWKHQFLDHGWYTHCPDHVQVVHFFGWSSEITFLSDSAQSLLSKSRQFPGTWFRLGFSACNFNTGPFLHHLSTDHMILALGASARLSLPPRAWVMMISCGGSCDEGIGFFWFLWATVRELRCMQTAYPYRV